MNWLNDYQKSFKLICFFFFKVHLNCLSLSKKLKIDLTSLLNDLSTFFQCFFSSSHLQAEKLLSFRKQIKDWKTNGFENIAKCFLLHQDLKGKKLNRDFFLSWNKAYIMFFSHKVLTKIRSLFRSLVSMTKFHVHSKRNLMKTENCTYNPSPPWREAKENERITPKRRRNLYVQILRCK